MIDHQEFGKLRLAMFCADDRLLAEEVEEHGDLVIESIRGIWFGRPVARPSETYIVDIDLLDFSTDAGPTILARLGLPLTRNSTSREVVRLVGEPSSVATHKPDNYIRMSIGTYQCATKEGGGYKLGFSFLNPGGFHTLPCYEVATRSLWQVRIERSGFESLQAEGRAR